MPIRLRGLTWDALGEWGMHVHEVENYFDVRVEKK